MLVRVLYGRNAGEVVDLPYIVARTQIDLGRARLPSEPDVLSLTVAPPVEGATTTATVDATRAKRRGKR